MSILDHHLCFVVYTHMHHKILTITKQKSKTSTTLIRNSSHGSYTCKIENENVKKYIFTSTLKRMTSPTLMGDLFMCMKSMSPCIINRKQMDLKNIQGKNNHIIMSLVRFYAHPLETWFHAAGNNN